MDGAGAVYSANLLGNQAGAANFFVNGVSFLLGPPNAPDAIAAASGSTVTLPAGNFTTLQLLATGVNGNQTGSLTVTYTDGTTSQFTQSFSDWSSFQGYSGERRAAQMAYRDLSNGTRDSRTFYLYTYSFSLNSLKAVKSVTLPGNRNVAVLAATLMSPSITGATQGSVWQYTGTPCDSISCRGWQELDNNSGAVAIAAGASALFELRGSSGALWAYTGTPCSGTSCTGWQGVVGGLLPPPQSADVVQIAADGGAPLELRNDGIWVFGAVKGPCGVVCPHYVVDMWQQLDNNTADAELAAAGNIYQRRNDGTVWYFIGPLCSNGSCTGWQQLDNTPGTAAIASDGTNLYEIRQDSSIWQYTGTPCSGTSCAGWQELSITPNSTALAAANGNLYLLRGDGSVWRYTGTPCGAGSCPGWQQLGNNPTVALAADGNDLYQLQINGSVWHYTGTPCSGTSCPGWQMLDDNAQTTSISAGGGSLYQLH